MIDINYSDGRIKINTLDLTHSFSDEQLPLTFKIEKSVSGEIFWQTDLGSFMWAEFPSNETNEVVVENSKGTEIYVYKWDVIQHGSIFYKALWLYCKALIDNGVRPRGISVGTHDGEFGEWVPLSFEPISDMLLVEASQKQFDKLHQNFMGKSGITFLNDLITTDGSDVEFFEGGAGYTNTVVERVIRHWETEEVHSSKRTSTSFNSLIEGYGKVDWLHLDVEDLDDKLLLSFDHSNIQLPSCLIFEHEGLNDERSRDIQNWLNERGYFCNKSARNTICLLNL
mgnify:CR=1 FL=1